MRARAKRPITQNTHNIQAELAENINAGAPPETQIAQDEKEEGEFEREEQSK